MQKYRSHKVVEAAPIIMHTDGLVVVRNADGTEEHVKVPEDFGARGEPSNGDYLVRYQPDGYLSWSPKAAFEDGYAPEPETWQERVQKEATDLDEKIGKLRKYLMSGPMIEAQALALLHQQYKAMSTYAAVLELRLRHAGVTDPETPPTVRGEA
jgi:hypothetical protein